MRKICSLALACALVLPAFAGPEKPLQPKKAAAKKDVQKKATPKPVATTQGPASIANLLRTRRVTVKLEKASLDQFVDYLRAASGINIVVNKGRIEKDGGSVDGIEIDLDLANVRLGDAIKLALAGQDLGVVIKGNILLITSKKDARGKPVLRIYSVAYLLVPIRDFPAPDMNIYPSNYEPPEPPEPEVQHTYESSEELAELIRNFTGKDTWDDEGVRITVFRHHLFIRTYPAVHAEIARLLAQLPH